MFGDSTHDFEIHECSSLLEKSRTGCTKGLFGMVCCFFAHWTGRKPYLSILVGYVLDHDGCARVFSLLHTCLMLADNVLTGEHSHEGLRMEFHHESGHLQLHLCLQTLTSTFERLRLNASEPSSEEVRLLELVREMESLLGTESRLGRESLLELGCGLCIIFSTPTLIRSIYPCKHKKCK
jgi:hypothetical protein